MYDPLRAKAKVVFFSAMAFLFGLGIASGMGWTQSSHAMPTVSEAAQVADAAVRPAKDLSDAFVNLAEVVTPAVVRIETTRPARMASAQGVPEAFRRFFDIPEGQGPQGGPQGPPESSVSGGSGFIVSEDGYILTNNHVVEGADEVRVYLADRRYFIAEIVGTDPFTDVAVVKINAGEPLQAMSFGDSDDVSVGEWILAIGNPGFGASTQLDYTVTAGIVSARGRGLGLLNRDLQRDRRYGPDAAGFAIEDFIQTDAVINPGNSGGPMVNLDGQVVGINSAIASATGYYQGYGFAIPMNLARRVMEDLVEFGVVQRPRIGVSIQDVAAEDAEAYGLPNVSGVLVQDVQAGGPADDVLQSEDVIVSLDGEPVGYTAELQAKIAERRPGDRVEVGVYRDRERRDVTIRLDEAPIQEQEPAVAENDVMAEERLGFNVEPLTEELAAQLGYDEVQGVVISDIARGSPAARRGLGAYQGWRLTRVNENPVTSPAEVRRALDGVGEDEIVSLHVAFTDGTTAVVNIRMPE